LEVEKWTPISSARVIVSAGAAPKKTWPEIFFQSFRYVIFFQMYTYNKK
jgi:hypothetical protein